ncbi:hypothetical protein GCM10020254_35410 [Streptomyces goshikiensis]
MTHEIDEERAISADELRRLAQARLADLMDRLPRLLDRAAPGNGLFAADFGLFFPRGIARPCLFDHTDDPRAKEPTKRRYDVRGRWTVPGRARPTTKPAGPPPRFRRVFPCRLERCTAAGKECGPGWLIESPASSFFFFLFVHVLDTALVRVSPEAYDDVVATYKNPIVALLEYGLVAAILFHALNGLRVIAVDFWSKGPRYQKQMLWSVVSLWVFLMIGALYPVLGHAAAELFGK